MTSNKNVTSNKSQYGAGCDVIKHTINSIICQMLAEILL